MATAKAAPTITGQGTTKDGRRVFTVASRTESNHWYLVVVNEHSLECQCKASQYRGQRDHRQDALRMAQAPVQTQLAQEERALRADNLAGGGHRWKLLRGHQDGDGDGQVVGWAFLAQVGGGEVVGDASHGEDAAAVLDRGAHALLGLVDRRIGQADDAEGGQPLADVHLDLDQRALESDDGAGARLGQHTPRLLTADVSPPPARRPSFERRGSDHSWLVGSYARCGAAGMS